MYCTCCYLLIKHSIIMSNFKLPSRRVRRYHVKLSHCETAVPYALTRCTEYQQPICKDEISPLTFFFMVLHISTYSMWSLGVLFSIISLRFFIRGLVGDDNFGFFCFLVCFAVRIALCWIISVMFLFRLSMSSRSSSVITT